jgi:hypothetical protein
VLIQPRVGALSGAYLIDWKGLHFTLEQIYDSRANLTGSQFGISFSNPVGLCGVRVGAAVPKTSHPHLAPRTVSESPARSDVRQKWKFPSVNPSLKFP